MREDLIILHNFPRIKVSFPYKNQYYVVSFILEIDDIGFTSQFHEEDLFTIYIVKIEKDLL